MGARLRKSASACVLIAAAFCVAGASAFEQAGDAAWQRRAEGFEVSGRANRQYGRAALDAYRRALEQDPSDIALHFKLMEAIYFYGEFISDDASEKRRLYEDSVRLSAAILKQARREAGASAELESEPLREQARRYSAVPYSAKAHFWAAINWGLWGMSHSYFASARKDVAERIRRHATLLSLIDERYADAGGYRLLGRLHALTPQIPFFTGWIDRERAVVLLRKAYRISQADLRNALFLAEAILDEEPQHREEARQLLKEVAETAPSEEFLVEQSQTINRAKELLRSLRH